jgi:hypothetical protein
MSDENECGESRDKCCENRDCEACDNEVFNFLCMECDGRDMSPFAHNKWDAENKTWVIVCENCCEMCNKGSGSWESEATNCKATYQVNWS